VIDLLRLCTEDFALTVLSECGGSYPCQSLDIAYRKTW